MLDSASEIRLAKVHPELSRRIHKLASLLSFSIIVVRGLATWAEQDKLYQQGRTTPGMIVTNAPAGSSMHNYGLAVDVAPVDSHGIDWTGTDAKWQEILAKAPECGLAEGAKWRTFPDKPHLYPAELPASPDDIMLEILKDSGVVAVWNKVDLKEFTGLENA